ncbi:hypothetical protein J4G08_02380 [Candidatus Poribacteria bacterium]|nr:hypothetical protein [Candidatus Poribacteria bacterium]
MQSVLRNTKTAWMMFHFDLPNTLACLVCQYRDIPMQVFVEMKFFCDFSPIYLEPAIHVMEFHTGEPSGNAVENERESALFEWVLTGNFHPETTS